MRSARFKSEKFHREETNQKQNKTFPLMRSQGGLPACAHVVDSPVDFRWMFNPDTWIFSIVLILLGKEWCKRENKACWLLTDATSHLAGLDLNWPLYNFILFHGPNWFFCLFKLTSSLTQSSDWLWWPSSNKHSDASFTLTSGADRCLYPKERKLLKCCTLMCFFILLIITATPSWH